MENDCLVSVIVPVFNVKSFLPEALDSLLAQTYQKLEIILVDDGSNDGSEKICDAFAKNDGRIRVIHKQNEGVSAARNTGLSVMHGEVVAFLDSDDAFHPEFVRTMLTAMQTEDADMAICKYSLYKTERKMCYSGHLTRFTPM